MLIGERVDDRYEIIKPLGEGGMSTVYLAKDLILKRDCVLKVLRKNLTEQYISQFKKEVEAVLNLNDPNIIKVYDCQTEGDLIYIVYEYADGDTLKDFILDKGHLSLKETQEIGIQICQALIHSHWAGIIHRDIKPQNIIVTTNHSIKLMDFGIATSAYNTQPSVDGRAIGSAQYISPEQARGEAVDVRTDIYSFGIVLYEMLTGEVPFKGKDAVEVTMKQVNEKIPSVRLINPDVPQPLENIISRATAKKREHRYSSFKSLLADLMSALDETRADEEKLEFINLGVDSVGTQKDLEQTRIIDINNDHISGSRNEDIIKNKDKNWWQRQKRPVKIGIVGGLITAILLTGWFFLKPEVYTMPDLVGMTEERATKEIKTITDEAVVLTKDNFVYENSDTIPEGEVISTKPKEGVDFKEASEIKITISLGPEDNSVELPDYIGADITSTKEVLENAGFEVIVKQVDSTSAEGTIVSQFPAAGEKADPSVDEITLEVSRGNLVEISIPKSSTLVNVQSITNAAGVTFSPSPTSGKESCAVTANAINGTYKKGDSIPVNWDYSTCVDETTPPEETTPAETT